MYGYLEHYHCFQAGDDTLEFIEESHVHLHRQAMKEAYGTPDMKGMYGTGQVLKEINYSKDTFSFLSKEGIITPAKVLTLKR